MLHLRENRSINSRDVEEDAKNDQRKKVLRSESAEADRLSTLPNEKAPSTVHLRIVCPKPKEEPDRLAGASSRVVRDNLSMGYWSVASLFGRDVGSILPGLDRRPHREERYCSS